MRILNLFNSRQVENVYLYSGSAQTDGIIGDVERTQYFREYYGDKGFDIYNAINTTNGQAFWDEVGNELYLNPRQIFFGLQLEY
jgi:hypothetical protein